MKNIFIILSIFLIKLPVFASGLIYQDTIEPIIATNMQTDDLKKLKCGEAQIINSFGLIETGHAGIQKAAARAGITKIHHVDYKIKHILFWTTKTVQVYGE